VFEGEAYGCGRNGERRIVQALRKKESIGPEQ
jgi:hypothetical protein